MDKQPKKPINQYRRWINLFVSRHQLAWDLSMAALALVYIGLIPFEDESGWRVAGLSPEGVAWIELVITLVFVLEFALRFYAAESRGRYLRQHWIDLLALLPAVRALRFLRVGRLLYVLELARFLRLGALVRLLTELQRLGARVGWITRHNGVHIFLSLAVGLTVLGGALVWDLEHNTNVEFHDFGNAIWWAFSTMTTVGYGSGPTTVGGRIVAAVVMIVGIGCFGLMTATVTTFFIERTHGPQVSTLELKTLLEGLHARLDHLERELEQARAQVGASVGASVATPSQTMAQSAPEAALSRPRVSDQPDYV